MSIKLFLIINKFGKQAKACAVIAVKLNKISKIKIGFNYGKKFFKHKQNFPNFLGNLEVHQKCPKKLFKLHKKYCFSHNKSFSCIFFLK